MPTLLVFSLAYRYGVAQYFIDYYFVGNLTTYAQIYAHVPLVSQGFISKLVLFPIFIAHYSDFLIFIVLTGAVVFVTTLWINVRRWQVTKGPSWGTILVLLTTLGALWAVIMPGTEFGHHLLLLVFPLGWVTGMGLQFILHHVSSQRLLSRLPVMAAVLLILELVMTDNLLLPICSRLTTEFRQGEIVSEKSESTQPMNKWMLKRNPCLFSFPDEMNLSVSPVSQVIKQYTIPSDQIAIWGWSCRYYVETGLAQGVSENHTQRSIIPNDMRNQYLNRYARELRDNQPAVFLDAVGHPSLLLKNPNQAHEHFALINQVIQQNYALASTVDSVRIYVRLDRLFAQKRLTRFLQ